jgi:outer membrane lipoprotein-sorting protein
MNSSPHRAGRLSRRAAIAGFAALGAICLMPLVPATAAAAASPEAQKIANHFTQIRTMMGEFVQFGPRGEQTGGKFYIERPGKIRFNYEAPAGVQVIADGKSVVINNKKLKTWDLYPLSKTPLKLLLDDSIDLSTEKVSQVSQEKDLTTIRLQDRSVFGDATITMMFDPESYELRQWTITDSQGKDTTVMIFNVKQGVTFDPSVFAIDYQYISRHGARGRGATR